MLNRKIEEQTLQDKLQSYKFLKYGALPSMNAHLTFEGA
jgi:hypothetical protein